MLASDRGDALRWRSRTTRIACQRLRESLVRRRGDREFAATHGARPEMGWCAKSEPGTGLEPTL